MSKEIESLKKVIDLPKIFNGRNKIKESPYSTTYWKEKEKKEFKNKERII
jgi:hypothetical protein